jgi:hypothetical protein
MTLKLDGAAAVLSPDQELFMLVKWKSMPNVYLTLERDHSSTFVYIT